MISNKKVGIGLVTYERPFFLRNALYSIKKYLSGCIDQLVVCDDGSTKHKNEVLHVLYSYKSDFDYTYIIHPYNMSVVFTKNDCLRSLLDSGCDYIFLMENDMTITSDMAVKGYIETYERTGIHHLNFAHHGPFNDGPPYDEVYLLPEEIIEGVDVYSGCVGAWSFYTRECLEDVGLMDENLCLNAFEHVEHTLSCAEKGYTFRFWRFPDVTGSKDWIVPQEHSIETSTIRSGDPNWYTNMHQSLDYVKQKHPGVWHD